MTGTPKCLLYHQPVDTKRITYTATLQRDDLSDTRPQNIVMTWTPDGKNIIYRSRRYSFNDFKGQLFSVSAGGGLSSELPLGYLVDFVPILRMATSLHLTGCFANSERGNIIMGVWQMTCGSMILKQMK